MNIKIDCREPDLYKLCSQHLVNAENSKESKDCKVTIFSESLPIGDVILEVWNESSQKMEEIIIIERKTVADLDSSIKDGRYAEQSYRLSNTEIPNHNIIYLIEGSVFGKSNKSMLYSAMFSLNFTKGFSLMRSSSVEESAYIIWNMVYKIQKKSVPYYTLGTHIKSNNTDITSTSTDATTPVTSEPTVSYCSVSKRVKKDNITPENISEIMLSQIPGISTVSAIAIMKEFKTLQNLMASIKENPLCLNNITYTNEKNQTRKINKTIIVNITKFLL